MIYNRIEHNTFLSVRDGDGNYFLMTLRNAFTYQYMLLSISIISLGLAGWIQKLDSPHTAPRGCRAACFRLTWYLVGCFRDFRGTNSSPGCG